MGVSKAVLHRWGSCDGHYGQLQYSNHYSDGSEVEASIQNLGPDKPEPQGMLAHF